MSLATTWKVPSDLLTLHEAAEVTPPRCSARWMCSGAILKYPTSRLEGECCCCRQDHGLLGPAMCLTSG